MRITGGTHKSRRLFSPKGNNVRPTSDKVRQAIFNVLNARGLVQEAVVIDAFCGTGALGLEALSQGASSATFFDKSKSTASLCQKNIEVLKKEERSQIILQDVTKIKERPDNVMPATLVFLDPPYRQGLVEKAITSFVDKNWLTENVHIVIEAAKEEKVNCPQINIFSEKIYGDTKCLFGTLK